MTADQRPTDLRPMSERAAAPADLPRLPTVDGLTWRPLTKDDAPALSVLMGAVEEADAHAYRTSVDEVAESFDGSWYDHEHDTIAGIDVTGAIVVYGRNFAPPGGVDLARIYLSGGVHPLWRRRGLGAAVLAWQVARARQVLAVSGQEVPGRIGIWVPGNAAAQHAAVTAAGLTPIRYSSRMHRSLAVELPAAPALDGLVVTGWSAERDEQIRLAHNETFADHWGSQPWTAEVWSKHGSTFAPQWSVVAIDEHDDAVAGYAMVGHYPDDVAVTGYTSAHIDLLGVRRAWRGRRVATALLTAVMQRVHDAGLEYVVLEVDDANPSGAQHLYASLGFTVTDGETLYTIEL